MPFEKNISYFEHGEKTIAEISNEVAEGLHMLHSVEHPLIGIFGSHITPEDSPEYAHCKAFAKALAGAGYGTITGGGPGIMHAANTGSKEGGVTSVGMRMSLLRNEHVPDHPYTHTIDFKYMMVRRFIMSIKSEALVFYPGGYGTLNEFFEYIVLMQTGLADRVPTILINKEFWEGMFDWIREQLLGRGLLSHDDDLKYFMFADTVEEAVNLVLENR